MSYINLCLTYLLTYMVSIVTQQLAKDRDFGHFISFCWKEGIDFTFSFKSTEKYLFILFLAAGCYAKNLAIAQQIDLPDSEKLKPPNLPASMHMNSTA